MHMLLDMLKTTNSIENLHGCYQDAIHKDKHIMHALKAKQRHTKMQPPAHYNSIQAGVGTHRVGDKLRTDKRWCWGWELTMV
jgi:hypothetical protein